MLNCPRSRPPPSPTPPTWSSRASRRLACSTETSPELVSRGPLRPRRDRGPASPGHPRPRGPRRPPRPIRPLGPPIAADCLRLAAEASRTTFVKVHRLPARRPNADEPGRWTRSLRILDRRRAREGGGAEAPQARGFTLCKPALKMPARSPCPFWPSATRPATGAGASARSNRPRQPPAHAIPVSRPRARQGGLQFARHNGCSPHGSAPPAV